MKIDDGPLEERRKFERSRYEELNKAEPLYGAHNHGASARGLLMEIIRPQSVLDVGCGDNSFAKWISANAGINATGVDFADKRADVVAPAHRLPFNDGEFDWITSFDMLEHLWPDEIDETLAEWRRVAKSGILVSISYLPSEKKVDGGNLHRTIRPITWWVMKLAPLLVAVNPHRTEYLWGEWR